jgi:hypothetical protein
VSVEGFFQDTFSDLACTVIQLRVQVQYTVCTVQEFETWVKKKEKLLFIHRQRTSKTIAPETKTPSFNLHSIVPLLVKLY